MEWIFRVCALALFGWWYYYMSTRRICLLYRISKMHTNAEWGGGESSFPIEEDPIHRDWLLTTTVSLFFFFFSLYSSLPFSWLSIWTPQPWASFVARLLLAGCCIPSALLRGQTRALSLHHTAPISLSSQTYLSNLFWFLFSPLSGFIGKKHKKHSCLHQRSEWEILVRHVRAALASPITWNVVINSIRSWNELSISCPSV